MSVNKDISITFVLQLLRTAIGMGGFVLFTRLLGAESYGTYILFEAVVFLFAMLGDVGVNDALEKRLSGGEDQRFIIASVWIKLVFLFIVSVSLVVLRENINEYLGEEIAILIIPAIISYQSGRMVVHILRGYHKIRTAAALKVVQGIVFVVLGLWFFTKGNEIQALIIGYAVSWATIAIIGYVYVGPGVSLPSNNHIIFPSSQTFKSIFDFSLHQFISNVGSTAYKWTDTLLIGFFLTGTQVTGYEAVWRISSLVLMVSNSVATVLFPTFSKWAENGEFERIESTIPTMLSISVAISLPALAGSVVISENILVQIFSSELKFAAPALIILLAGKLPEAANNVIGRTIMSINKPQYVSKSTIVLLLVNVSMNLIFIPIYETTGAAIATTTAFSIHFIINWFYLTKDINISVSSHAVLSSLSSSILMGIVIYYMVGVYPITNYVRLFFVVLSGILLYFLLLYVTQYPTPTEPVE